MKSTTNYGAIPPAHTGVSSHTHSPEFDGVKMRATNRWRNTYVAATWGDLVCQFENVPPC